MYLEVKVTDWKRIQLPETMTKEDVKELHKGLTIEEFVEALFVKYDVSLDNMDVGLAFMEVDENGGNPTLELYDGKEKMLFNNAD